MRRREVGEVGTEMYVKGGSAASGLWETVVTETTEKKTMGKTVVAKFSIFPQNKPAHLLYFHVYITFAVILNLYSIFSNYIFKFIVI